MRNNHNRRDNHNWIQNMSHEELAEFLQKFASETYGTLCEKGNLAPMTDSETQVQNIEKWLREAVKPKESECMLLELDVIFHTDGDFSFNDVGHIFNPGSPLYDDAVVNYKYEVDFEYFMFQLRAKGGEDSCFRAARDLLENLICHLSPLRYYLVRDIYDMLSPAIEQLWSDKCEIEYNEYMGGNYDGTYINMEIRRV